MVRCKNSEIMLKFIFYASGIVLLIHEISFLISPISSTKKRKEFYEKLKSYKDIKIEDYDKEFRNAIIIKLILMCFLFSWIFIGFFTFQWFLFIAFLIIDIVFSWISRPFRFNLLYIFIQFLISLLGALLPIFAIINAYHLKLPIEYFINLFR